MSRLKRPIVTTPSAADLHAASEAIAAAQSASIARAREQTYVDAVAALVAGGVRR